jgi:hypothetical protein
VGIHVWRYLLRIREAAKHRLDQRRTSITTIQVGPLRPTDLGARAFDRAEKDGEGIGTSAESGGNHIRRERRGNVVPTAVGGEGLEEDAEGKARRPRAFLGNGCEPDDVQVPEVISEMAGHVGNARFEPIAEDDPSLGT